MDFVGEIKAANARAAEARQKLELAGLLSPRPAETVAGGPRRIGVRRPS